MAKPIEGIFSIRIVVADFYMQRPTAGLDPCYSEFRGKEIKSVPIIRIFGTNAEGQKTCMHVHGVLPYLYIPYESKDLGAVDKFLYQISMSLDKALNISLGQGSSETQHIFKVQLVKGIPFYGYHKTEHQYLKIFLYQPRFVKRAANLLQNGVILGKVFQPHESHVPYMLQFLIDYNLYGMSFLHTPKEIVKFRRDENEVVLYDIQPSQILGNNIPKLSTSQLEVDINAAFILNRFQLMTRKSQHTNPGIESIWLDEMRRRQLLREANTDISIPSLEIPPIEERPEAESTESDLFYKKGLLKKLTEPNPNLSLSQSMNATTSTNTTTHLNVSMKKSKFNLSKFLINSVYPEECSQNEMLINASIIHDHLTSNDSAKPEPLSNEIEEVDENVLDETMIDTDMVLNLTQNENPKLNLTMRDYEVLEVMRQLEEGIMDDDNRDNNLDDTANTSHYKQSDDVPLLDGNKVMSIIEKGIDDGHEVDLDSTLAPLSQKRKGLVGEKLHNVISDDEDDDAEINMNDFTIAMEDIDDIYEQLSQACLGNKIPQLDGGDNELTPKKTAKNSGRNSPRPKIISNRYAALNIVTTKSPNKILNNEASTRKTTSDDDDDSDVVMISSGESDPNPNDSLRKRRKKRMDKRKKSILNDPKVPDRSSIPSGSNTILISSDDDSVDQKVTTPTPEVTKSPPKQLRRRAARQSKPLDKTFVTCNLKTPKSAERKLKIYDINKDSPPNNQPTPKSKLSPFSMKKCVVRLKRTPSKPSPLIQESTPNAGTSSTNSTPSTPPAKKFKSNTDSENVRVKATVTLESNKQANNDEDSPSILRSTSTTDNADPVINLISDIKIDPELNSSLVEAIKVDPELNSTLVEAIKVDPELNSSLTDATQVEPELSSNTVEAIKVESELNSSLVETTQVEPDLSSSLVNKIENDDIKAPPIEPTKPKIRKCKVLVKRYKIKEGKDKPRVWSPCDVAREYDRRNNFFPKPGPSKINYYDLMRLPRTKRGKSKAASKSIGSPIILSESDSTPKTRSRNRVNRTKLNSNKTPIVPDRTLTLSSDSDGDSNFICSFYERSFIINSPSLFSDRDSPSISTNRLTPASTSQRRPIFQSIASNHINTTIITPENLPPTFAEVMDNLAKYKIPDVKYIQPYYGNPADVTKTRKEIGHTVLTIPGNTLSDCQEFVSLLPDLNGLRMQRRTILQELAGSLPVVAAMDDNHIKEYFCTNRVCKITLLELPPTSRDAKIWLKAKELTKKDKINSGELSNITIFNLDDDKEVEEDDSPIEVQRQKVIMMLNNNSSGEDQSGNEIQNSVISVSPATPIASTSTNLGYQTPTLPKRTSQKSSKAKLCLSAKINEIQLDTLKKNKIFCVSNNKLLKNIEKDKKLPEINESDNSNDSVSNESVMAELQKSTFKNNLDSISEHDSSSFGLSGASLNNTFGFKVNLENLQNAKADIEYNYLTTMSIEVFVPTRDHLKPNPELDAIECLFYSIVNNVPNFHELPTKHAGYIMIKSKIEDENPKVHAFKCSKILVDNEEELFNQLLQLCRFWDPDIFAGYEIEMNSWGYVIDRSKALGLNLLQLLSRVPSQKVREVVEEEKEQLTDLEAEMRLCGRILLDVWRLMRSEIALTSYTYENVMYHILHKRVPLHSFRDLSDWYKVRQTKWIIFEYFLAKVNGTLDLLDQLDLIGRTSEMAKLIGIQFYEVLSRGSQYRVESMMLRIAKPKNLIPLSPSVDQRVHMRAPEYLPLILEPQSRFYTDPVIVLDFQSLYPSIIIAYNYCFSTCLGRVEHLGQSTIPFEFGASQLRISPATLKKLLNEDKVTVSPCGAVFVKSEIRDGVLPRMLSEILNTRLMVKQSMKLHKSNSVLQRVLHSRQLGLKLMANVTYGYTAANFSGRMPCVEVGDSVVAKGRETLERAIKMVEANEKWRAKVVYGDTDSLFVLCPGRSKTDAFKIGEEISEAVTKDNPHPLKLKLEKVYLPCILQTKKRYVGNMYESADQKEAIFEAKGIETVRRDGCPAVGKILEKTLKILFETKDVSKIKEYVCRQFTKLLQEKANVQDLIYAKEFRGKNGYKPTACVPALELTRKWLKLDPRNEPRRGERVPYVITNGPPGVPLIRLIRSPHEFLADEGLKLNSIYYITKAIIPPLNRCLLLIGADVNEWFLELPRKMKPITTVIPVQTRYSLRNTIKKSTISQYFASTNCVIDCGRQTNTQICSECMKTRSKTIFKLLNKITNIEHSYISIIRICQTCCGRKLNIDCSSLDCPVLYVNTLRKQDMMKTEDYRNIIAENF